MRFCILYDSYAKSNSPLKDVDLPGDPAAYLPADAEVEYHVIHKATAVKQIIELSKRNFDVFVNVCDGAWDEDRPGIEVVQALERLGLAFTGADANFYEPSREKMKLVCHYWGIKTPAYVFAKTDDDIERAAATLRYPMIVKHASSYSSIGMTRDSRVTSAEALRFQAQDDRRVRPGADRGVHRGARVHGAGGRERGGSHESLRLPARGIPLPAR
ncbi:MAG: hypothetical protein R2873_12170 [Caldilineaceae bacterium]